MAERPFEKGDEVRPRRGPSRKMVIVRKGVKTLIATGEQRPYAICTWTMRSGELRREQYDLKDLQHVEYVK